MPCPSPSLTAMLDCLYRKANDVHLAKYHHRPVPATRSMNAVVIGAGKLWLRRSLNVTEHRCLGVVGLSTAYEVRLSSMLSPKAETCIVSVGLPRCKSDYCSGNSTQRSAKCILCFALGELSHLERKSG